MSVFMLVFKSLQYLSFLLFGSLFEAIILVLIIASSSGLCLAATGNVETRTINFPLSGLGRYFINRPDVSFMAQWPGRDLGMVAKGRVVIPKSAVVSLETASAPSNCLSKLASLNDGDLQSLDVSGAVVTHSNLKYILGLKHLQSLVLIGTAVDDRDLERVVASLPNLTELDIGYTSVTDRSLRSVSRLRKLSRLHLRRCRVSAAGLLYLTQLRTLTFIDVSQSSIENDALEAISKMQSLTTLNLAKTNIDDRGLKSLLTMSSLRRLDLSKTRVSDSTLHYILGRMSLIEELNLSETKVSDLGLSHLRNLNQLKKLWLRGLLNISDGAIAELIKHRQLTDLEIQKTNITEQGLSQLARALPRCEVHSKPPCSCQRPQRVN